MFVVVESGFRAPYVPGRFRPRQVDPIQKVPPADRVDRKNQEARAPRSHQGASAYVRAYEAVEAMNKAGRTVIVAQDVMSAPAVRLSEDATFQEAHDLFQHRRFRHVPVTNDQGQVLGIVSDRDLLRGKADPGAFQLRVSVDSTQTAIHHFMSRPVLVAHPQAEIRGIVRVMFEEHVGAMPIVSEAGELLGIITRSDILRVLISHPDFDQWI
jgi:acetoin utilization protein AcuB